MTSTTFDDPEDREPEGAEVFDFTTGERLAPQPKAAPDTTGEPDEDPDAEPPKQVDPKDLPAPSKTAAKRHAVLASWAKNSGEFKAAAAGTADLYWYIARFHAVRLPWYSLRLSARAPRGAGRTLRWWGTWVSDREGRPVVADAVARNDATMYLRLSERRQRRILARTVLTLPVLLAMLLFALLLAPSLPRVEAYPLYFALILAFGVLGRQPDKPVLSRAVEVGKVERLTSEVVLRALGSIGIEKLATAVAKGTGISFPTEIARDGAGYRAVVDLPYGVTADDVIERRIKLASGLRRPLGCVWPEPVPEDHEGRLILWVGDKDMSETKKPAWPLLKAGTVDLFKPFPVGIDPRGRWVTITLMYASMVIGAVPRMGKTFFLRLLLLAAALDPRSQLYAFDLKGTGDFRPFEPVAHRYAAGDDDEEIEYGLAAMRELRTEMRRRAKVLRALPVNRVPESKVTPELASDKALGLFPIVLAVDECQRWFEHKSYGDEFTEIAEDLVRRGPALGIITAFATQRPDAKSLPTGISGNAILRFCLKVMDHIANDIVLGTGRHKQGIKATLFRRRDLGMGYLVGEGDDPRIVASSYVDSAAAEKVIARARTAREAAGTITGYAAGVHVAEATSDAVTILDDLAAILDRVRFVNDKVWGEELLALLAEYRPETYGEWNTTTLTTALKPYGVKSVPANRRDEGGKNVNRKGYDRAALTKAVTERN